MLIKVYKYLFTKLKEFFVNKIKVKKSFITDYPQHDNVCNSLKNNKLKTPDSGYYHIHNAYYNY